jgi:hypothetical protein
MPYATKTIDLSNNVVLNFGFVQGPTGATGATGANGDKGDKGNTGDSGGILKNDSAGSQVLSTVFGLVASMAFTVASEMALTYLGFTTLTSLQIEISNMKIDNFILKGKVDFLMEKINVLETCFEEAKVRIERLQDKTSSYSCTTAGTTIYGELSVCNPNGTTQIQSNLDVLGDINKTWDEFEIMQEMGKYKTFWTQFRL